MSKAVARVDGLNLVGAASGKEPQQRIAFVVQEPLEFLRLSVQVVHEEDGLLGRHRVLLPLEALEVARLSPRHARCAVCPCVFLDEHAHALVVGQPL